MTDPRLTPERTAEVRRAAWSDTSALDTSPVHRRAETILALLSEREEWQANVHPSSLRGQWEELRRRRLELEERDAKLTAENERLRAVAEAAEAAIDGGCLLCMCGCSDRIRKALDARKAART